MTTEKEKKGNKLTKLYIDFPYEMGSYEDELKVQEAINYAFEAGKSETIKLGNELIEEYFDKPSPVFWDELKGEIHRR